MTTDRMNNWIVGGASVRGPSHERRNAPNEDAWLCLQSEGSTPAVAAVSDGHGAAVHFRSRQGAELAVRAASVLLGQHLDDADGGDLASGVLSQWRNDVRQHMATYPYTDDERELVDHPPLSPYGATLVAMGVNAGILALLQIGDGDLILGYADGRLERPFPTGPALVGEQTYSLCQEQALSHFQSAVLWRPGEGPWPDFILLATDGVSKSFRSEADFLAEVERLRLAAHTDWQRFLGDAPAWLSNVTQNGSGDDATLCVAVRPQAITGG